MEISCAGGSIPPWRNRFVVMKWDTLRSTFVKANVYIVARLVLLCANLLYLLLTFFRRIIFLLMLLLPPLLGIGGKVTLAFWIRHVSIEEAKG